MSVIVSVQDVVKHFGARSLFEGLTVSLHGGDRVGLIGPNGAGKTTLLRILAGEAEPDSGELVFRKGLRLGYLAQIPRLEDTATVEESVAEGAADLPPAEAQSIISASLARLGLNSGEVSPDRKVGELSGGWKKRVALAREMARRPDLLLLDEPTNHLDVESILWLEGFLSRGDFATLTITHDRLFLQRVANRIVELDKRHPGGVLSVAGNYSEYLKRRGELLEAQKSREASLKNRLRRETEWLLQGAKARSTKQRARIQRAESLKDEVAEIRSRNQQKNASVDFQGTGKSPKRLLEVEDATKSVGGKALFKDFSLLLAPGSRVGLLGHNGCGKSTLIRGLLGREPLDSGKLFHSEHLKVAYFEQNRESLDPESTVAQTVAPDGDQVIYRGRPIHVRSYLDRFLFRPEQMDMAVGRLSGGEQSRLLIAKLMLKEANVLVLDEPTNDLDIATLDVLQESLEDFPGAVLLVSHDRYFLDQVADTIVAFDPREDGSRELTSFASLRQWESWRKGLGAESKSRAKSQSGSKKTKKLGYLEQRELDGMEEKIHKVEKECEALTAKTQLPENQTDSKKLTDLFEQLTEKQKELDSLYARWEELELKT